ncbi:MAG: calcium-binding protein [Marivivens sp.]|nr:calcium-binding protein [Marivivens sp.]
MPTGYLVNLNGTSLDTNDTVSSGATSFTTAQVIGTGSLEYNYNTFLIIVNTTTVNGTYYLATNGSVYFVPSGSFQSGAYNFNVASHPTFSIIMGTTNSDANIAGTSASDLIYDTNTTTATTGTGNDTIYAGAGNDTVIANDGNDVIYGGTGNDSIQAGSGTDIVYGEDGNDTINAGTGADTVYGGAGTDSILGGDGNDQQLQPVWRLHPIHWVDERHVQPKQRWRTSVDNDQHRRSHVCRQRRTVRQRLQPRNQRHRWRQRQHQHTDV